MGKQRRLTGILCR